MHACVHACMHACMRTRARTHTHTHTCIHAYIHTHTHTCMYTCIRMCMRTCMQTDVYIYMWMREHMGSTIGARAGEWNHTYAVSRPQTLRRPSSNSSSREVPSRVSTWAAGAAHTASAPAHAREKDANTREHSQAAARNQVLLVLNAQHASAPVRMCARMLQGGAIRKFTLPACALRSSGK